MLTYLRGPLAVTTSQAWGQSNSFPESFNAAVRAGLNGREILGNLSAVMNSTVAAGTECAIAFL